MAQELTNLFKKYSFEKKLEIFTTTITKGLWSIQTIDSLLTQRERAHILEKQVTDKDFISKLQANNPWSKNEIIGRAICLNTPKVINYIKKKYDLQYFAS